jgi:hypothetical protein
VSRSSLWRFVLGQVESPVKLSEVSSKYEQLGQLVGVQTQRLAALQESGTDDDCLKTEVSIGGRVVVVDEERGTH